MNQGTHRYVWAALATAMAASFTHLATMFARYEPSGGYWWLTGVAAAVAVDVGIIAGMRAIGDLSRAGQRTRTGKGLVIFLGILSGCANAAHVAVFRSPAAEPWEFWLGLAWAAALPGIVIWLAQLQDELGRLPDADPPPAVYADPVAAQEVRTILAPVSVDAGLSPESRAIAMVREQPGLSASQISRRLGGRPSWGRVATLAREAGYAYDKGQRRWVAVAGDAATADGEAVGDG